ncbi:MAG: hypothetical protein RL226_1819 [Bacteroidota bacterium]|jgi:protein TonB
MSSRKSKQADLEKRRGAFFQLGLVATLALVLIAFSITTTSYAKRRVSYAASDMLIVEEIPTVKIKQEPRERISKPIPEIAPKIVNTAVDPIIVTDPIEPFEPDFNPDDFYTLDWTGDENDPIETLPIGAVEILPYFHDCENVTDRDQQRFCSEAKLRKFISENVKMPRDLAGTISGTSYVTFTIDEFGRLVDAKIERSLHKRLDAAILKAFSSVPLMHPGSQQGKPVRVIYTMPVAFRNE